MNQTLTGRIVDIAHMRRRLGYRRTRDLMRPEFSGINHKRVYRRYRVADLSGRHAAPTPNRDAELR